MLTVLLKLPRRIAGKIRNVCVIAVKKMKLTFAFNLHRFALYLRVKSCRLLSGGEKSPQAASYEFSNNLLTLHKKIYNLLLLQKNNYKHYAYFSGYPYQSLGILNVFGDRGTEERFEAYELAKWIKSSDTILDIGCNCGFMSIFTSFRTGCSAEGIDINPHMISIGNEVAAYLNLSDKVKLITGDFKEFKCAKIYSVIFSFATHWTDDKNYRVSLDEHFSKLHTLLQSNGLLVFESHYNDVGQESFYDSINRSSELFRIEEKKILENGCREFYYMRKID